MLFQPTEPAASVLADRGIRVDSSVYKGGVWQQHKLDYRRALKNGYYWRFTDSVDVPNPVGKLLELPILTRMVPPWKLLTNKRVSLQKQGSSATQTGRKLLSRLKNYLRFSYPLKLDFCSMGIGELIATVERARFSEQWTKDGGSFIPHPATWLNQRRWEDEEPEIPDPAGMAAHRAKPWWTTAPGIEEKARALGVLQGDEAFPHFKHRVFEAAGPGPWVRPSRTKGPGPGAPGWREAGPSLGSTGS